MGICGSSPSIVIHAEYVLRVGPVTKAENPGAPPVLGLSDYDHSTPTGSGSRLD